MTRLDAKWTYRPADQVVDHDCYGPSDSMIARSYLWDVLERGGCFRCGLPMPEHLQFILKCQGDDHR